MGKNKKKAYKDELELSMWTHDLKKVYVCIYICTCECIYIY